MIVLILVTMVWVAAELGLDILLGVFAAGMVFRLFSAGASEREAEMVEAKLQGLGFGFLIPVFFIVSGMRFDVDALVEDPIILVAVPAFVVAFLLVRGGPAFLQHRAWPMPDRLASVLLPRHRAAAGRRDHRDRGRRPDACAQPPPPHWWPRRCCRCSSCRSPPPVSAATGWARADRSAVRTRPPAG